MQNQKNTSKNEYIEYMFVTLFSMAIFMILMSILTGKYIWSKNPYNSYTLQANSWLKGRLDLGQDYPWLELAIKNGKYYVSFPPFPSYIMFIFSLFVGLNTPDFAILYIFNLLAAGYMYLISKKLGANSRNSALNALFATIGSNFVFLMIDPSVWFIAQIMSFSLATMSIYYALNNKVGRALFFWACAVGCRPMQAIFIVVLIYIIYTNNADKSFKYYIKIWKTYIPAFLIALSYMLLNYFRFGKITEFGHNYLPEFVRAEHGQFSKYYMSNNIKTLFAPIQYGADGKMIIDHFGNLNMFIASPIFIYAVLSILILIMFGIKRKNLHKSDVLKVLLCLICSILYMTIIVMHKTMGAWQFGCRYSVDIIPWIYLLTVWILGKHPRLNKYIIPFMIWGICLNTFGSVVVYNGL